MSSDEGQKVEFRFLNTVTNKANASGTEAACLDLNLSTILIMIHKIYDKRDDFDFDIVNFLFLGGDVPRRPSYGRYNLNLFALPEYLRMLVTSIVVTNS